MKIMVLIRYIFVTCQLLMLNLLIQAGLCPFTDQYGLSTAYFLWSFSCFSASWYCPFVFSYAYPLMEAGGR